MLALKILLFAGLVLSLPVLFFLVGKKSYSLSQQRKTRQRLAEGNAKAREGDIRSAVRLLLKAERSWAFNSYDGSRQSLLRDVQEYGEIASGIFRLANVRSGPLYQDVNGILNEMRTHLNDRNNFGVDGRRMKPDAKARWDAMCLRLKAIRPKLRATCELQFPR